MPTLEKMQFAVAEHKCVRCGACAKDCPNAIIKFSAPQLPTLDANEVENCIECQHCFAVCPTGALLIFGLRAADSSPLGGLPTYQQIKTFVRGRRSVRQYAPETVDRETIGNFLRDLAHSPTGCNDRALVFSVIHGRAVMEKYLDQIFAAIDRAEKSGAKMSDRPARIRDSYRQQKQDILFRGAPHLLLVSLDLAKNPHCGTADVLIAATYFEFLAQAAGLGTTWLGMLEFLIDDVPEIREIFRLPRDTYFYAMLFGKPSVKYARTAQRDNQAQFRELN